MSTSQSQSQNYPVYQQDYVNIIIDVPTKLLIATRPWMHHRQQEHHHQSGNFFVFLFLFYLNVPSFVAPSSSTYQSSYLLLQDLERTIENNNNNNFVPIKFFIIYLIQNTNILIKLMMNALVPIQSDAIVLTTASSAVHQLPTHHASMLCIFFFLSSVYLNS